MSMGRETCALHVDLSPRHRAVHSPRLAATARPWERRTVRGLERPAAVRGHVPANPGEPWKPAKGM
eukprot:7788312-Alexandrium_andersonii.AAC.1